MSDPVTVAFNRVLDALGSDAAHAVYELIRAVMDEHEEEFHRSADSAGDTNGNG